jgi:hypothetical protein
LHRFACLFWLIRSSCLLFSLQRKLNLDDESSAWGAKIDDISIRPPPTSPIFTPQKYTGQANRKWGRNNFTFSRHCDFHTYIIFTSPIRVLRMREGVTSADRVMPLPRLDFWRGCPSSHDPLTSRVGAQRPHPPSPKSDTETSDNYQAFTCRICRFPFYPSNLPKMGRLFMPMIACKQRSLFYRNSQSVFSPKSDDEKLVYQPNY